MLRALPDLRVRLPDRRLGEIRPGKQEEVERMVVEVLEREQQVAGDGSHRGRLNPESQLERQGGGGGMDTSAHPAGPAGDEDRVTWVAPFEDHLIAAEQRGHRVGLEHLPALQVDDRVEGEGPGNTGDRIEVDGSDVAVPLQELLQL